MMNENKTENMTENNTVNRTENRTENSTESKMENRMTRGTANLIRNMILIVIGAALMIWTALTHGDSTFSGFGGGLLGVGILQLFRTIRYRRNKEYQEQVDTAISDERNNFIRMKAWSWTGYMVVMGCAIATVVCMILKQDVYMQIFASVVSGTCLVYWISYMILARKY